jgi:hypothetical protein
MSRTDRQQPKPWQRSRVFGRDWVRPRNKKARRIAREALAKGTEPEPSRPRHSALWDYF